MNPQEIYSFEPTNKLKSIQESQIKSMENPNPLKSGFKNQGIRTYPRPIEDLQKFRNQGEEERHKRLMPL